MSKSRTTRIYWRKRLYGVGAYGDFRDYADVGGSQEALVPAGQTRPTADADTATRLVAARLIELETARERLAQPAPASTAPGVPVTLRAYAERHLRLKAALGRYGVAWLSQAQRHLEAACDLLGPETNLRDITVTMVSETFLMGIDGWAGRRTH